MTGAKRAVTVFGAYGHTGRFVIAELMRRGCTPILAGRDAGRLHALAAAHPGLAARPAAVDDAAGLDAALAGAAAVINCAGPFADTAAPLVEAALRAGIHYLDVAAEAVVTATTLERYDAHARAARVVVAPAAAFYGGLGDLLATAAMGEWARADELTVAFGLDGWHPTPGTRLTGTRTAGRRLVFTDGRLEPSSELLPSVAWDFPAPLGRQELVGIPTVDIVTIARHLGAAAIRSYFNAAPLRDLRDPATPPPVAADASGRSAQTFLVHVVARRGGEERHAIARGRDIYAVTAPIVVGATERILDGRFAAAGAVTLGQLFDAAAFLRGLEPDHLAFELRSTSAA